MCISRPTVVKLTTNGDKTNTNMTRQELEKALEKLNKQIDELILSGRDYRHLEAKHARLVDLLARH